MGVEAWSTTAASNNASPPNGAPEGMAPSGVNDCIRQIMADVRSQLQDGQWLNWGHTPTRVDDDTFTVATDLTTTYHAGRRLKVTGSATGYCTIASSSYSNPNTTVNVTMDSGNLPGTLSAVYVAMLTASNSTIPSPLNASNISSGSLADARLSSNVPLKDASNIFTGSRQTLQAASPDLHMINTSAAADNQRWSLFPQGSVLRWRVYNDAESSNSEFMTVTRSGTTVTSIAFAATAITGNGSAIVTAASPLNASNLSSGTVAQARLPATSGLVPLISVGAALNISAIVVGQVAYIYKNANTSRTTDDTLTIDPVLQFTNAPAGTYATEGTISFSNADSTADFQISWPRAVDDSGVMSLAGYDNTATASDVALPFRSAAQEISPSSGGSSTAALSVTGIEVATAGQTLGPLWAQATAHASATAVRAGSWLKVTRLS
jgi:hypothetical protein